MGKFIDNVYQVWQSPDKVWEEKGNGKTKWEFLLSMAGFIEGRGHQLDVLSGKVTLEYEDDPEKANMLLEMFDTLARNWSKVEKSGEINNIESFLVSLRGQPVLVEEQLDILESLNPYRKEKFSVLALDQLFLSKNEIFDTVMVDENGAVEALKVKEYVPDQDVFIFCSLASSNLFLTLQQEGNLFIKEMFDPVMDLVRRKKFVSPCIVVGKANFHKRLTSVTISFRNAKIKGELVETLKCGKQRIFVVKLENHGAGFAYCVS